MILLAIAANILCVTAPAQAETEERYGHQSGCLSTLDAGVDCGNDDRFTLTGESVKNTLAIRQACKRMNRHVIGKSYENATEAMQQLGWHPDEDNALEWHKNGLTVVMDINLATDIITGTIVQ